jgi:hypothetical protein
MEHLYKDFWGEWRVSMWKDGKYHYTGENDCTYTKIIDNASEEVITQHVECFCQNKELTK